MNFFRADVLDCTIHFSNCDNQYTHLDFEILLNNFPDNYLQFKFLVYRSLINMTLLEDPMRDCLGTGQDEVSTGEISTSGCLQDASKM